LPDSWVASTRTIDMMFTGRTYSAEEGASLGFSLYLIEDGKGLIKGLELAKRIPAVLGNFAVIRALLRISDPKTALLTESLMAAITLSDGEAKVRVRAFS
jgi:enoyl-CoA hydratase/carnithine racemase